MNDKLNSKKETISKSKNININKINNYNIFEDNRNNTFQEKIDEFYLLNKIKLIQKISLIFLSRKKKSLKKNKSASSLILQEIVINF